MLKEQPKALLTDSFIALIALARELNENKKISGDLYFHPAESDNKIIVKTTDLNQRNPLREVNSKTPDKQDWEERWIEAYLMNKAKKSDWELDLAGKKYKFLASQFTFRASPNLEKGRRKHTHVDLLLYDEEKGCLVVLELKKQAVVSGLEAQEELEIYVEEIKRLIKKENTAFNKAFNLGVAEDADVIGYIVCPKADRVIQKRALGEFRLIQYTKPWKNFVDVKESGSKMKIEFTRPPNSEGLVR